MAYRWRLEGPAFEFPTPYGTENRFLTLRGYALIALAVVLLGLVTFVGGQDDERAVVVLDQLPEPASVWPHVFAALLLVLWGALDLLQAAGQRLLLLTPGQPASLAAEVSREAAGASPSAGWLMRAMSEGAVAPGEVSRPYQRALRLLGPELAHAPQPLHAYLRLRISHAVLAAGLALLLAGAALALQPPALALVALVVMVTMGVFVLRSLLLPEEPALPTLVLGLIWLVALLLAGVLAAFAASIPLTGKLPKLGLPVAAAVLLGGVLLAEALALLAARTHVEVPRAARLAGEAVTVGFDAHPGQFMQEVDRELSRRWSDGVPNRRYAWVPPKIDPAAEQSNFSATMLEESQPLLAAGAAGAGGAGGAGGTGPLAAARRRGTLVLGFLGWLLSMAGALLWVLTAYQHMRDSATAWTLSSVGLACLLVGQHAVRVTHLLWSRLEVDSTLLWLDIKGLAFRLPGAQVAPAAPAAAAGWARGEAPVAVENLVLRVCAAQLRSVFYAAGPHDLGSRTLLNIVPLPKSAAVWTALARDFAAKAGNSPAAANPALVAARIRAREQRLAQQAEGSPASPRRAARFCSACGTPVLAGARFCQNCGHTLAAD